MDATRFKGGSGYPLGYLNASQGVRKMRRNTGDSREMTWGDLG